MWSDYKINSDSATDTVTVTHQLNIPKHTYRLDITYGFTVYLEKAPNAFYRKMQELVLGFKYTKLGDK